MRKKRDKNKYPRYDLPLEKARNIRLFETLFRA